MNDQGLPVTYTTTHTTTTTETTGTTIQLDLSYFRTVDGILKCVQIALDLLGFICIISSIFQYHSRGTWFNTVSMGGFWFTTIMLVFYVFHVTDKLSVIPWFKIEFVFCTIWTVFYLIAASLCANFGQVEAMAAAAFFGFCAMIAYGYDAFLKFTRIKSGPVVVSVKTNNQPQQY